MTNFNINFCTDAIEPMFRWLKKYKDTGVRKESELLDVLELHEYSVEFLRYGDKNLPVCGISKAEAVDFFMNFDNKDFDNPRLAAKKPSFLKFFDSLDERIKLLDVFSSLTKQDEEKIKLLLKNSVPNDLLNNLDLKIILIISIGNSMGWPYGEYLDFDVANLDQIESKEAFVRVIAHEIHHICFNQLLEDNGNIRPSNYFQVAFAFEGLAVHYCNNAKTKLKPSKYDDEVLGMQTQDMQLYESEFDLLFEKFKTDLHKTSNATDFEQPLEILKEYEKFTYTSLKDGTEHAICQYPTYFLGCYFWGSIDLAFGMEKVYAVLNNPDQFVETYNQAAVKLGNANYLL